MFDMENWELGLETTEFHSFFSVVKSEFCVITYTGYFSLSFPTVKLTWLESYFWSLQSHTIQPYVTIFLGGTSFFHIKMLSVTLVLLMPCSNWKNSLEKASVKPGRYVSLERRSNFSIHYLFAFFSVRCSCKISIFPLF